MSSTMKSISICAIALLAVCCVAGSNALELVEMTDANRAILPLDLAKALKGVQEAYGNEFKFDTVAGVRKFLVQCVYVNSVMKESDESAFEGLAAKMKAIMAEPSIARACSVKSRKITNAGFDELDDAFEVGNSEYLSIKKFNKLVEMRRKVNKYAEMNLVLGHLLNKRIQALAEEALKDAPGDVEIFFDDKLAPSGMFDFSVNYKDRCNIDLVKPICKLVRRSTHDDIAAIGQDFAKFAKLVVREQNNSDELASYVADSGVTLDTLRDNCVPALKHLKPIEQIARYQSAGFISEQQLNDQLKSNPRLDFYNEMYKLCKVAAATVPAKEAAAATTASA